MIDKDRSRPPHSVGCRQESPRWPARWPRFVWAAAIALSAVGGGAAPALAVNGETSATLYSADAPSGYQITFPCDMGFNSAVEAQTDPVSGATVYVEAAKVSCHLWDEAAPDTEPVADKDLGLAADVQIEGAGLALPGDVDEENETITSTTFAQMVCGLKESGPGETEFCLMAASTAGAVKKKGKRVEVTPGALGRLLISNDGCVAGCAASGGPFSVTTDASAIADENAALRLVYPEAAWVEWMFSMNNTDIGDPMAYGVTLDAGLSAAPVSNGSSSAPLATDVRVAPAEHFSAINTPGVYCSISGVCIFY